VLSGPSGKSNGGAVPQDQFRLSAPQITLPKGGGAISGISEKFAANPVTGTGSMTVRQETLRQGGER
jgi:hypothetical protein